MISHFSSNKSRVLATVLITILFCSFSAYSETTQEQFNNTFRQMLKDPSNIKITMQYANEAAELKNYEAAIPALERILLFNPSLASVKVELGTMYYFLNSKDVAKRYFSDALDDEGISSEDSAKANEYLEKI
jgi:tetratricopeptide (TPR) repeat protein